MMVLCFQKECCYISIYMGVYVVTVDFRPLIEILTAMRVDPRIIGQFASH